MKKQKIQNNGAGDLSSSKKIIRRIRITGFKDKKITIKVSMMSDYRMHGGPGYSMI